MLSEAFNLSKSVRTILLAGACAAGILLAAAGRVRAATPTMSLFTTQSDWSQWSAVSAGVSTSVGSTGDTDGSITDGIGNSSTPLSTGTAGAMTDDYGSNEFAYVASPGEQANPAFLSAVANAPTLLVDYTPPASSGTYFDPLLVLNYNGAFTSISPTSLTNEGSFVTGSYPIPAGVPSAPSGGLSYFQLEVVNNTDQLGEMQVDNIRATLPASVTTLFTTQDDWSQWGSPSAGVSLAAGYAGDADGDPVNGLGHTTAPGQVGTTGGLKVSLAAGAGTFRSFYSPDEHTNIPFLTSIQNATTLTLDFTYPTGTSSYFDPVLLMAFDGHFDEITSTTFANLGAFDSVTYTLPGDLPADLSTLTYFQMGFAASTDDAGTFTLDNISVSTAVPEPASISALGVAGFGLLARRRRRALERSGRSQS